ncbi:MAG: SDR family NAD(P)-dependent oxidoreductase [Patescibacteria group bacterium]
MKTVLITGISRGIGKSLAEKFLAEGYFVIGTSTKGVTDITHENLIILQLDLADPKSIEQCAEKILHLKKPIDILINNAGIVIMEREGIKIDNLRNTLETNVIGPIDLTLRVLSAIQLGGHIVNISSRQGSMSYVHQDRNPSYKISKAATNMFTRTLSLRLQDRITVSSVHPGAVLSGMAAADADMSPEEAARYIYELAISKPKTGQFWFKGEPFPW